jgi:hypothetical protein
MLKLVLEAVPALLAAVEFLLKRIHEKRSAERRRQKR